MVLLIREQGAREEDELSLTGFTNFISVLKLTEMQRCSRNSLEDLLGPRYLENRDNSSRATRELEEGAE